MTSLQCQNATFSGGTETMNYSGLTIGVTYYVRVYNWSGATPTDGSFTICIFESSASASNCTNPTPIPCGGSLAGQSNIGAGDDASSWACHESSPGNPIATDGEDVFYEVTATSSGFIRVTFDNVSSTGTSLLEVICAQAPCVAGTCFDGSQLTVSTGLFGTGFNSYDFSITGAGTYYIIVDAQGSGSTLNWDISIDCYATGILLDNVNSCGAGFGTGDPDQGIYTTWNGATAPASYDASLGGTFTVCENVYIRNVGWEWLKTFDLSVGSCWTNIRNVTPTGNNFCFHAVNDAHCATVNGWSAAITGNTINWTFLHPNRYTNPPPTCTDVSTWGDGSLLPPPYTCALYTFCYDAVVNPACIDVNGLQNTVSASDDGIGGTGGTMASNILVAYPWAVNSTTLPIQLMSFRVACNNNENSIYWATASETNNDYFTLERSFDGENFESIYRIPGAANSTDIHSYRVFDDIFPQVVYYRLSQTDFDGTTSLLKTIAANCNNVYDFNTLILNDCNNGYIVVKFESIIGQNYNIIISDVQGRIVHNQNISSDAINSEVMIPVTTLSQGIYTLKLSSKDASYSEKFFID